MTLSSTGLSLNLSLELIWGMALCATSFLVLLSAVGRAPAPKHFALIKIKALFIKNT